MPAWLLLPLLLAAAAEPEGRAVLSQDITVRAKAGGPAVSVPPPAPSKPVVDEVLRTLSLGRGGPGPGAERVRVSPETAARLESPFPEPPFLALSPENIEALYDSWSFEVLGAGEIVWRTEGVGLLRERLDWTGLGPYGRLAVAAGESYSYRFTGRRGARSFVIESEPVRLRTFSHREYVGETRLEAAAAEIFEAGKDVFAAPAKPLLDAMAERLSSAEPRPDKRHRLELYSGEPRGRLAKQRAASLAKFFANALAVPLESVNVAILPPERGEAVAAFLPPSRGPGLRIE